MKVLLKQKSKELYTADFDIIKDENIIGNVFVQGRIGSMEARTTIKLPNAEIVMEPRGRASRNQYRLYNITINNDEHGYIYQRKYKTGFLAWEYKHVLEYDGNEYIGEGNGIGTSKLDGMIKNENGYELTIYNDMYNYDVECSEGNDDLYKTLIYTMYKYLIAYYKPGQKVTKSVQKIYFKGK